LPVLNILENSNYNFPCSNRLFNFQSKIVSFQPLKFNIIYNVELFDTICNNYQIINDSTILNFSFDSKEQKYKMTENYKINENQIFSYYLYQNDLYFINSHYQLLNESIKNKNNRDAILNYLDEVLNQYF